jgi:hypothetical protein
MNAARVLATENGIAACANALACANVWDGTYAVTGAL